MAKRADSRYQPGKRTRDWLKVKTHGEQEFVIAGYTRGQGRRARSLRRARARRRDAARTCVWVGNVGTGLQRGRDRAAARQARARSSATTSPFPELPKMPRVRKGDVVWVEPELVAEVEFAEWTHDGRLRAPSYQGLRDDKAASEVRATSEPSRARSAAGERVLKLSNLDKVFWPDEGITKGDLLAYYRAIAPVLVPHLRDRPFTMKRYPDGIEGKALLPEGRAVAHAGLDPDASRSRSRPARRRGRSADDPGAARQRRARAPLDGEHGLHRHERVVLARRPARPARLRALRPRPVGRTSASPRPSRSRCSSSRLLDALGLEGFPKTSGADGMHVLVPIARRTTYARHARVRRDRRRRARARRTAGSSTTRVVEGEAPRRADRREPERRGQDDRVGLLGAAAAGRAGLDAAALGRGDERLDPRAFTMEVVLERVAGTATCSRAFSRRGSR